MKAIYIDPANQTVTEIDCAGDYYAIRDQIEVDLVTVVHVTAKDDLWLDDEGLLKMGEQDYFRWAHEEGFEFGHYVYAGKGLILGHNNAGDCTDCKMTVADVERRIMWMTREEGNEAAGQILSRPPEFRSFDTFDDLMDFVECINGRR